ncbi:MarR family transcriptional regulator [Archangium minus]|uniref:MarR family transcriptional regulator n=1 Tax=Archangium minus TaxID=83450 RepID=A0ABY9X729_9BACT|nr:MarR family transcriptional regulator [Archangium minus]
MKKGRSARSGEESIGERHSAPRVEGVDYGVLDELVGYAVRRAQIRIFEDFAASLSHFGITPARFSTLQLIAANPGLKQTQLGDILGIARSGVMVLIDSLVEQGLVRREPQPDDRRAYGVFLTPAGQTAFEQIRREVLAHDRRISARLSAQERARLLQLLEKLASST